MLLNPVMVRNIRSLRPHNRNLISDSKRKLLHKAIGHGKCIYSTVDLAIYYLLGPLIISIVVMILLSHHVQNILKYNVKSELMRILIVGLIVFAIAFVVFRWYCVWQVRKAHCKD